MGVHQSQRLIRLLRPDEPVGSTSAGGLLELKTIKSPSGLQEPPLKEPGPGSSQTRMAGPP